LFEIFCLFRYNREKALGGMAMNVKNIAIDPYDTNVEIPAFLDASVSFEDIEAALKELLLLIQSTHSAVVNPGPQAS